MFFELSSDRDLNCVLRAGTRAEHHRKYDHAARANARPRAYIGTT